MIFLTKTQVENNLGLFFVFTDLFFTIDKF